MLFPDLTSTLAHHYSDDRSSSQDPLKLLLVRLGLEKSTPRTLQTMDAFYQQPVESGLLIRQEYLLEINE